MSAGARRGSLLFHSRRGGRALAPVVEGVTARCQAGRARAPRASPPQTGLRRSRRCLLGPATPRGFRGFRS